MKLGLIFALALTACGGALETPDQVAPPDAGHRDAAEEPLPVVGGCLDMSTCKCGERTGEQYACNWAPGSEAPGLAAPNGVPLAECVPGVWGSLAMFCCCGGEE